MIDINKEIAQLNWNKEPRGLYEPIEYTLASGGKRLRPHLAIIAAEAVINGGLINSMDDVLPAALALEVFHNFTLVHDDVMDRAEVRRGQETVHRKWNNNTSILSGDQMLIEAYKLLAQVNVPVYAIVNMEDIIAAIQNDVIPGKEYLDAMLAYRAKYGVTA